MSGPDSRPMPAIGVRMHGVTLNLRCDYGKLLEHTEGLLAGFTHPPFGDADIEVTAAWRTEGERDAPFFDAGALDRLGKRMLLGVETLVWPDTHRNEDLQLRFGRHGETLLFDVGYHYAPSTKKLAKYPDYERKKFFDLLRYLVLFPIAWRLERERGWVLVHASAVADGERAVLVAGPGGCGKTTTSVALAAQPGMRLVSENLLFTDGERVWPLAEPIRLTDESLSLLGDATGGLEPLGDATRLKYKSMYRLPADLADRPVRPEAIFIPRFSESGYARPIGGDVAAEMLRAMNRLTLELCDYDWYGAALDLLWPEPGCGRRNLETLRRLAAATPCWSLGIDRSAGVGPVIERIGECWLGAAAEGRG